MSEDSEESTKTIPLTESLDYENRMTFYPPLHKCIILIICYNNNIHTHVISFLHILRFSKFLSVLIAKIFVFKIRFIQLKKMMK